MVSIRQVEHPKEGQCCRGGILFAANRTVQAPLPELRFPFWTRVHISEVILKNVYDLGNDVVGGFQMCRRDQIEIISRRVIFRKRSKLASLKQANGKVKARRAILPLIVPIG